MAARKSDGVSAIVAEVEALAKRVRADIAKTGTVKGLEKQLRAAAKELRKQAIRAAAQVEKYAHQLRQELEGGGRPASRKARRTKAKAKMAA